MIKKVVSTLIILMLLMVTTIVKNDEAVVMAASNYHEIEVKDFEDSFYSMSTRITLTIYKEDTLIASASNIYEEIKELFTKYHNLTSNFDTVEGVNNVKYINNHPETKILIEKELYEILIYAEEMRILTDGYFDISIGKIIDEWKWLIDLEQKLSNKEFDVFVERVKKIPVIEGGIILEQENNEYYVTIKEGVKIDLGALSKGYAVARGNELLKAKGLVYYRLTGSFSSLQYGEKPETKYFTVGVTNGKSEIYGTLKISNKSITTSGDTVQGAEYNKRIYHHIISPKTKMPENNNSLITIIHDDAGFADAFTTALFSMDDKTRENWLEEHGDLEYILFKTNGKVINNFPEADFTVEKGDDTMKTTIRDWIIISAVIVIAFLGFYMISKAFTKLKFDQAAIIYRKEIMVLIKFEDEEINIVKEYPQGGYDGKIYPIIDYENKTITVLGDFEINGILQEMVFTYDFEKRSIQAIKETSPHQEITKMGVSTGKDLISLPYNIIVRFGDGEIKTDDII